MESEREPYVAAPDAARAPARSRPDVARRAAAVFAAGALIAVAGTVAIWRSSARTAAPPGAAAPAVAGTPRWLCIAVFDPSHLNFATIEVTADGRPVFASPLSAEVLDSPWPTSYAGPYDFRVRLPGDPTVDLRVVLRNPKGEMLMEYAARVEGDRVEDLGALQGKGFAGDKPYGLKTLVVDDSGKPLRQSR